MTYLKGTKPQPDFQIAAVIGITSETFKDNIILCFTEKLFLLLMSNMFRENQESLTDDIKSGVAELLNRIYGHAKAILNHRGFNLASAIPTVIQCENIKPVHLGNKPVIVLEFGSTEGVFQIVISTS